MNKITSVKILLPLCLLAAFAFSGPLASGLRAQAAKSSVSRAMDQAIRLYHEGEDTEAMDRFMDILVKGSPSEKALANEYISKITLRMNTGVNTVKDKGADPAPLTEVSPTREAPDQRPVARPQAPEADEEDVERDQRDDSMAQKDRVNEKISSKIARLRQDLLLELGRSSAVKVYMGDNMPKALTLDPQFFFAGGNSFRPGTDKMLGLLSGLLFTLGKTNCLILPDGTGEGDVKIKSIRRALAVTSYFESRGISKSRLEVNLTGADVHFPKELTNIGGIIIIFDYDKAPRLKDTEDLQTKGPRVSLGVYPTAISVQKNEGAIVEFSAFESPVGVPSWKFQVFEVEHDGSRIELQEISGNGAQYNQSFWNGRKKFFGAPYPSGKYMFTVTATDAEGRESSLSRLLLVRPSPAEEKALLAGKAPSPGKGAVEKVTPSGIKARSLKAVKPAKGKTGKLLKKPLPAVKKKKAPHKKAAAKAPPDAPAEDGGEAAPKGEKVKPAAGGDAQTEFSGQVSYKIYFKENSSTITSSSEKRLAQVAETLAYYPMSNVSLTGYSYSGEANPEAVAESRVSYVAARLSEKYKIDPSRIDSKSEVSETPKHEVVIKMTGKE